MPKNIWAFALFCLAIQGLSAQIEFEKGYFIDNSGKKIECLIKNMDWRNNPTEFEYKFTENGPVYRGEIDVVKEFSISNGAHYTRHTVELNKSSELPAELDIGRRVTYVTETLFLKNLVKGEANLLYYENKNLRRFFYSVNKSEPTQLVYKKFKKEYASYNSLISENTIIENNEFRQQLWNDLRHENFNKNRLMRLQYKMDPLVDFFNNYNKSVDPDYVIEETKSNLFGFNMTIRPGFRSTALSIDNSFTNGRNVNFEEKISFSIGVEFEAILPFNKNKWSVIVEPTFQKNRDEGETMRLANFILPRKAVVEYTSLEIPIGVRHYIFLNDKSKLFINPAMLFDIPFSSGVTYGEDENLSAKFGFSASFVVGIGFKLNEFLSLEARYIGKREVFSNDEFLSYESEYAGYSVILGYTIF